MHANREENFSCMHACKKWMNACKKEGLFLNENNITYFSQVLISCTTSSVDLIVPSTTLVPAYLILLAGKLTSAVLMETIVGSLANFSVHTNTHKTLDPKP